MKYEKEVEMKQNTTQYHGEYFIPQMDHSNAVFPQRPAIYGRSYTTSGLNPSGFGHWDHFWVGGLLSNLVYECTQDLIPGHHRPPQVTGGHCRRPYD